METVSMSLFSPLWLARLAGSALLLILIAGAIWLLIPGWIATLLSGNKGMDRLKTENSYRKALAQIFGFPLALLGALGVYVAVAQALATYQQSQTLAQEAQELAYQDLYRHGFEALATTGSRATRIGGLYTLQGLINRTDSEQTGQDPGQRERGQILLRALAAFAVEHPAKADQLVPSDALTALQILAFRKTVPDVRFDLRTGKFPGSVLSDDPSKRYADFRHFDLYKVDLSGSDLYRAQIFGANLRLANFNGSNLAGTDLSESGLSGTTFCPGLNFAVPAMVHTYPASAEMANTTFYSASGEQTRFDEAHLCGAIFNNTNFMAPVFAHTLLRGAHFENAVLDKPDFTGADLTDASFEGATLNQPIFTDAVLTGTNLHAKGIVDNDLRGARMCQVIGPSGKRLSDDCKRGEQESASRDCKRDEKERVTNLNPVNVVTCRPPDAAVPPSAPD
jgi:uncharacterized protein YjbI with pentapeptide repeats